MFLFIVGKIPVDAPSAVELASIAAGNGTTSDGGGGGNLKSLRSLRALRALRPLRMINRQPQLKKIVNALFKAIPAVVDTVIICILFWIIFGVLGVNLLKGAMNECQGEVFDSFNGTQVDVLTCPSKLALLDTTTQAAWLAQCSGTAVHKSIVDQLATVLPNATNVSSGCAVASPSSKDLCECWGASWSAKIPQNFDNIGSAILGKIRRGEEREKRERERERDGDVLPMTLPT
jgi:hypothetical protein